MIVAVIGYMIPILIGAMVVWYWIAFVAEMIAWHRGTTSTVHWPDEILWMITGRTLLDNGLYGGARVRGQSLQRNLPSREGTGYSPMVPR